MRVLLLIHNLGLTGASKLALDVFKVAGNGISVRTLALQNGERLDDFRVLGPVDVLPGTSKIERLRGCPIHARIALSVARWKPDLIYINSVASLPIMERVRTPNTPTLLHVHELDSYLSVYIRSHSDLLVKRPSRYIAVSSAVSTALSDRYGICSDRVTIIPAFVDEDDFAQFEPQKDFSTGQVFTVGGSGYPVWHKGVTLWLQMAANLTKILGREHVRFVWVGMPNTDVGWQYRAVAGKLGIENIVTFIAPTTEPLPYYQSFDVFALTSWEDSCPLVVLENMMLGNPVACFAESGGAPEEVGDTGIVIHDFSPADMAKAIGDLARSPKTLIDLGERARARVQSRFTAAVNVPRILQEINSVLTKNGVTRSV